MKRYASPLHAHLVSKATTSGTIHANPSYPTQPPYDCPPNVKKMPLPIPRPKLRIHSLPGSASANVIDRKSRHQHQLSGGQNPISNLTADPGRRTRSSCVCRVGPRRGVRRGGCRWDLCRSLYRVDCFNVFLCGKVGFRCCTKTSGCRSPDMTVGGI